MRALAAFGVLISLSVAWGDASPPSLRAPSAKEPARRRPTGFIVPADRARHFYLDPSEKVRFWTPSQAEVDLLEERLPAFLKPPASKKSGRTDYIAKNLSRYGRQYVGLLDDSGAKRIWVSLIWLDDWNRDQLTKGVIMVSDGGDHYCRVTFELQSRRFEGLECNGVA